MTNEARFADQPLLLEGSTLPEETGGINPFMLAYRCLRGRIVWAVLLGAVFAVPAGLAGYKASKPQYTSIGMIEVKSYQRPFLYEGAPDTGLVQGFDKLKKTQIRYLENRRVIDRAVQILAERDQNWPRGISGVQAMYGGMRIIDDRGAETISVTFTSTDRAIAQNAVDAILDSYQEIYGEKSAFRIGRDIRDLETHIRQLEQDQDNLIRRVQELALEYGTDDLRPLFDQSRAELRVLSQIVNLLDSRALELKSAGPVTPDQPGAIEPTTAEIDLDHFPLADLAMQDSELATLLIDLSGLEQQYRSSSHRLKPMHREMVRLTSRIELTKSLIVERVLLVTERVEQQGGTPQFSLTPDRIAAITDLDQAQQLLAEFESRRDLMEQNTHDIGAKKLAIDGLQNDLERKRTELRVAEDNLTIRKTEAKNRTEGRIEIAQRGDLPFQPSVDRRVPLAMAGLIIGMCFGVGLIGLWGLIGLGFDYIDDFEEFRRDAPLLGVIPDLNDPSAEEDTSAALSVHHLRNLLQVKHGPNRGRARIYTITSPTSGDGKTSLTLALGISFAAVGHRTLVIDADMTAGGLSRQLGLGNEPGLWEALQAGYVNGDVHETQHLGLFAMPGGATSAAEPEKLGKERLGSLLDELGRDFDTILLDTGPILGSLDASLAAANSDDVIITVARGQKPRMLRASIDRLHTLGISCAGIVFNRASWSDIRRSVSPASLNSHSTRSVPSEEQNGAKRGSEPRYSLGGAVAGTPKPRKQSGPKK